MQNILWHDLFQKEGLGTICTLCFAFVCDDEQAIALWTWLDNWALPRGEIAIGVIHTTEERASLAGLAFDKVAAIFGTGNTDLLQPRLGITTFGKAAA